MTTLAAANPTLLFLAGCAVLTWVLLRRCYGRCGRKKSKDNRDYLEHLHRPTNAWDGACHDAAALVDRQKVELYEMARDVSGRLDSKLMLLNHLIATSQKQIDRMEELLAELDAAATRQETAAV